MLSLQPVAKINSFRVPIKELSMESQWCWDTQCSVKYKLPAAGLPLAHGRVIT